MWLLCGNNVVGGEWRRVVELERDGTNGFGEKQSARKSVGLLAACGASVVLALAGALGQK